MLSVPCGLCCTLIFVVVSIGPSSGTDICVEASKQLELCKIVSERMRRCLSANLYNFQTILIPLGKFFMLKNNAHDRSYFIPAENTYFTTILYIKPIH